MKDKILNYIKMERQSLRVLNEKVKDIEGDLVLTETGQLVDTLLSNIEYIIKHNISRKDRIPHNLRAHGCNERNKYGVNTKSLG